MGRPITDLTGQRFGKLVAIKLFEVRNGRAYWVVRCDCGTIKTIDGHRMRTVRSCGCARREAALEAWERRRADAGETRKRIEAEAVEARKERIMAEGRESRIRSQMLYNQRAGTNFDDFWMFGHDGEAFWNRVTRSTMARQSP